jgi:hypothetical protein
MQQLIILLLSLSNQDRTFSDSVIVRNFQEFLNYFYLENEKTFIINIF